MDGETGERFVALVCKAVNPLKLQEHLGRRFLPVLDTKAPLAVSIGRYAVQPVWPANRRAKMTMNLLVGTDFHRASRSVSG
jgi:hypothetical protein